MTKLGRLICTFNVRPRNGAKLPARFGDEVVSNLMAANPQLEEVRWHFDSATGQYAFSLGTPLASRAVEVAVELAGVSVAEAHIR
jgi:hypothetical protein